VRLEEAAFKASPSNSIDYAVMERTKQAAMVRPTSAGADIGAWSALWEIVRATIPANVALGDVIALDTKNSYLRSAMARCWRQSASRTSSSSSPATW